MGAVTYDLQASAVRLEQAFPMHTEEGVRHFLEQLVTLNEMKYLAGDYDVAIWIIDFKEVLYNHAKLSSLELDIIHNIYFLGYRQVDLVEKMGLKKNTISTILKRAIKKIVYHYEYIKFLEEGGMVC